MYLEHYNLKEKPFNISPGPRFLWLGEKHSEALATLKYGILENKGFLLLTGDVGVGKTALIHRLIQDIDSSTIIANIPDPGLDALDLFKILASEFHMVNKFSSKGDFLVDFKKFLQKTQSEQKNVLLIIDEAQRLNEEILEQVRLLSNIEMSDRKLINIFFVGQPEFSEILMDPRNRAVRQRIAVNFHIDELTETETERYIHHRLKVAGATSNIFQPDAISGIYKFSRGCPRLINIMSDHALLSGYSYGLKSIGPEVIEECKWDLRIPAGLKSKKADIQQMPMDTIPPPVHSQIQTEFQSPILNLEFESEPFIPKFWEKFAFIGLVCVLGVVASYFIIKSGMLDATSADKQPYPPQQLVGQSPTEKQPVADEKTVSDALAERPPAPQPPVQETGATRFDQTQDSPSIGLQENQSEMVEKAMTVSTEQNLSAKNELPAGNELKSDVTLPSGKSANTETISPDQSALAKNELPAGNELKSDVTLPSGKSTNTETISPDQSAFAKNELSAGNESKSVASLPDDESNNPDMLDKTPDSEPKPSLETAAQSGGESDRVETKESSSDQIKRVVAGMAASQSTTPPPKREGETAASKKTTDDKARVTKEKLASNVPKGIRVINEQPSEEQKVKVRLERRLRSFLQNYCITYAAKDLDRFSNFFGPGAQENGKPFESLLPKYQKNFDAIDTIQYRIELQQYTYDSQKETVRIEGNFLLKWLPPDKKWRENSGKIFMDLKDDGRSFLVQNLDYYGKRQAN
jgi:general secretion pathway protein A